MDEMMVVEVKLRFANELMKWEDRKVFTSFKVIPGNDGYFVTLLGGYRIRLSEAVAGIAKQQSAVEARWNFKGSLQGHYQK